MVTHLESVEYPESLEAQRSVMRDLLVDRFAETRMESDMPTPTDVSDQELDDRIFTQGRPGPDTFQAYEHSIERINPVVHAWILGQHVGQQSAGEGFDPPPSHVSPKITSENACENIQYTPIPPIDRRRGGLQVDIAQPKQVAEHVRNVLSLAQLECENLPPDVILGSTTLSSIWEYKELDWESPHNRDASWYSLAKRYWSESWGYVDTTFIQRGVHPVPVPSDYQETSVLAGKAMPADNASQLTTNLMKVIMAFFHRRAVSMRTTLGCAWLEVFDGSHEYHAHVPRLYVRSDVTDEQKASLLPLFYPCSLSQQLARELASERLIGETIEQMLRPQSKFWTFISSTGVPAVRSDCIPLAVVLHGDPDMKGDDVMAARKLMTRALHGTLTLLTMRHYKNQGWDFDRRLTQADARVQLDEQYFVFSVLYSRQLFEIDINFPVLAWDKKMERSKWTFVNAPVMNKECTHPMYMHYKVDLFMRSYTLNSISTC
ncbi:uncharacterized protein B0H18DRAFT_606264 [Fomitopsis serialis]|uniref:uncharacterized protein n=1 Tax=Fomitopsis serialis TaxID=139415 RepID=UPI002008CB75|nr:uncharacterized protein B0H18DRAFT_606264 [Neoantrodia serialis]KAH9933925.1 hypothetical protein B0H18DRAFT_606264 [Neoantrodia serialis]